MITFPINLKGAKFAPNPEDTYIDWKEEKASTDLTVLTTATGELSV